MFLRKRKICREPKKKYKLWKTKTKKPNQKKMGVCSHRKKESWVLRSLGYWWTSQEVGLEEKEKKSSFTEEYIQPWTLITKLNFDTQIWTKVSHKVFGQLKDWLGSDF